MATGPRALLRPAAVHGLSAEADGNAIYVRTINELIKIEKE